MIKPGFPEGSVAEPGMSHNDADFWTRDFMVDNPIAAVPQQDAATIDPSPSPWTATPTSAASDDLIRTQLRTTSSPMDPATLEPTADSTSDTISSPAATPTIPLISPTTSNPQTIVPSSEQSESSTGAPTISRYVGSDIPSEVPNSVPVNGGSSSGLLQVLNSLFVPALGIVFTLESSDSS